MVRQVALNYKLNLKYGGLFRLARNSSKMVYYFGKRKCIYIDMCSYNLSQLVEEVKKHYLSHSDEVLSILFVDKYAKEQTFIQLETSENFQLMLNMYDEEKELTIYVTKNNQMPQRCQNEIAFVPDGENGSDSDCQSENSYHSLHSSDDEHDFKSEFEVHSDMKNSPTMKVHQKFSDVIAFRRALNHYAIINEFEYTIEKSDLTRLTACCEDTKCEWRIHASTMDDNITFQ
ncbi:transposase, MuDR, MULE transposase domain protein, partial [Tanacetum coccineum]